ncbi:hypothetical protein Cgig2_021875 [Carnegiea gigantea]|uniref:Uncharacterized protein n=1 Tax=Carnegiea gigantea TaxID=171969 RepID=A0A9Q1GTI5_9CARY|nr:hypothetical protein Cgig2_021875 [Carnegiea gigantea]
MESQVDGGKNFRRNFISFVMPMCMHINQKGSAKIGICIGFSKGYLEDSLDKTIVTDKGEEVNKEERCNKSVEAEAKVKDRTGVSKVTAGLFQEDKVATDKIITNKQLLEEVMTELEDTYPLKRVRKVAVEVTSNTISRGTPKKLKRGNLILSLNSYELEAFLMEIGVIERHFLSPPSFNLGLSQEENQALPKEVALLYSNNRSTITKL